MKTTSNPVNRTHIQQGVFLQELKRVAAQATDQIADFKKALIFFLCSLREEERAQIFKELTGVTPTSAPEVNELNSLLIDQLIGYFDRLKKELKTA